MSEISNREWDLEILEPFVTENRKARLKEVLLQRTRNLVLVLEDIYDPHNVSACVRSAEAMGLQELHVVNPRYSFSPNPKVTNGADKWLDFFRYSAPAPCIEALKERGFLIAASALTNNARPITEVPFDRPVALVMGNEHEGLSQDMQDLADVTYCVPMLGFSQSFNISVATALSLYHAVSTRARLLGSNGDLTKEEQAQLYHRWVKLSVPMAEAILARYDPNKTTAD